MKCEKKLNIRVETDTLRQGTRTEACWESQFCVRFSSEIPHIILILYVTQMHKSRAAERLENIFIFHF